MQLQTRVWFYPTKSVSDIETPVLIVLGKKDNIVLPDTTKEIFRAANEPKKLAEIDEMPHDYKKQPKFIKLVNKITGDFMQEYFVS